MESREEAAVASTTASPLGLYVAAFSGCFSMAE